MATNDKIMCQLGHISKIPVHNPLTGAGSSAAGVHKQAHLPAPPLPPTIPARECLSHREVSFDLSELTKLPSRKMSTTAALLLTYHDHPTFGGCRHRKFIKSSGMPGQETLPNSSRRLEQNHIRIINSQWRYCRSGRINLV